MKDLLKDDLQHIYSNTKDIWEELRGKSIFLTGGTGFFGIWFIETFIYINKKLALNASMTILSRNPNKFINQYKHISKYENIKFLKGDVKDFEFIEEKFTYIIHAGTTNAEATFNGIDSLESFDIIANGTRRVFDFAVFCDAKKILLTSSGSIYGQSKGESFNEESISSFDPTNLKNAASEAKRVSEFYASYYSKKYGIDIKIARCFTFVGPYLQLDVHYAIGNFIYNIIHNQAIIIKGDGTPQRSYMYISDLIIWLWTILFKGESCRPYNVGSEYVINIKDLAKLIALIVDNKIDVKILGNNNISTNPAVNKYVPSTKRAQDELGLKQTVKLTTALKKSIEFYKVKHEV